MLPCTQLHFNLTTVCTAMLYNYHSSFMITPEDRENVPTLYFVSRILLLH